MRGGKGGSGVSGGGADWDSKWRLCIDLCTKCYFIGGPEGGRVSARGAVVPLPPGYATVSEYTLMRKGWNLRASTKAHFFNNCEEPILVLLTNNVSISYHGACLLQAPWSYCRKIDFDSLYIELFKGFTYRGQLNSLCHYQRYPNEGSWFKCDTDFL